MKFSNGQNSPFQAQEVHQNGKNGSPKQNNDNVDWASIINSQAQIFNKMKEDTKLYQQQVKKAYGEEIKRAEQEKNYKKQMDQKSELNQDQQQLQALKQQEQAIQQWQKQEQRRHQQNLAEQYENSAMNQAKQNEIKNLVVQEDQQRIQEALKSLEREKIQQRMKRQQYKNELDSILNLKNQFQEQNKQVQQQQLRDDINNMQQRSQQEISNEFNYKSKFVQKDDKMKVRQNMFQENVMSPTIQKQSQLDQTIYNRERQYNLNQEKQEQMNKQLKNSISEERTRFLERQIEEKQQQKQQQKFEYKQNLLERKQFELDYKKFLDQKKSDNVQQQNAYRDILKSQVNIKQAIQEEQNSLTYAERQLAKEYISKGQEGIGMIPGQVSLSKYSLNKTAKYQSDFNNSPRGNTLKADGLLLDDQQQIMLKKVIPRHFGGNQSIDLGNGNSPTSPIQSRKERLNINESFDYDRSNKALNTTTSSQAKNARNQSFQEAAQMQLNNASPFKAGSLNYNPILNPIPTINQNPYISKGKLDHVGLLNPKGKIVKIDQYNRGKASLSVFN